MDELEYEFENPDPLFYNFYDSNLKLLLYKSGLMCTDWDLFFWSYFLASISLSEHRNSIMLLPELLLYLSPDSLLSDFLRLRYWELRNYRLYLRIFLIDFIFFFWFLSICKVSLTPKVIALVGFRKSCTAIFMYVLLFFNWDLSFSTSSL